MNLIISVYSKPLLPQLQGRIAIASLAYSDRKVNHQIYIRPNTNHIVVFNGTLYTCASSMISEKSITDHRLHTNALLVVILLANDVSRAAAGSTEG